MSDTRLMEYIGDFISSYSYFGARYYDPNISIWLSVDQLSDKYPSLSPYNYVLNNPIRFIDPDGRDVDPTPLREKDNNAWEAIKKDWEDQTGYALGYGEDGKLKISSDRGLRNADGIKTTSRSARRLLKKAIESDMHYTLDTKHPDRDVSSYDESSMTIHIDSKSIADGISNANNINPLTVGFGITAFHELAHGVYNTRDLTSNQDGSKSRGENVPIINSIRRQLGYETRRAYGTQVGDYGYIPFDRISRQSLILKSIPSSTSSYTKYLLPQRGRNIRSL